MSNICAAIGLGQIKNLEDNIRFRRDNHLFYRETFKNIKKVQLFNNPSDDFFSNYWLNTILLETEEERESLRLAFEEANIESRPLWKPMHLQPLFEKYPYYGGKIAEKLFQKGLCLPSGSNLTDKDKNRIKEVIINFFRGI
jgi:dTDP-4-amino-4,6-dideoxygalactose transaminase